MAHPETRSRSGHSAAAQMLLVATIGLFLLSCSDASNGIRVVAEPTPTPAAEQPTATAVPPSTQTTDAPTAETTETSDDPAPDLVDTSRDEAIALNAVLKLEDLESGWREERPDDGEDSIYEGVDACDDSNALRETNRTLPNAETSFSRGDIATVDAQVGLFPTETDAVDAMAVWGADEVETCFNLAIARSFSEDEDAPSDVEEVAIEVGRISVEQLGDDQVAWQIELTVTMDGGFEFGAVFEFEIVRVGRAVALLATVDSFSPLYQRDELMKVMVNRLEAENL